jgi:hypothetical protein
MHKPRLTFDIHQFQSARGKFEVELAPDGRKFGSFDLTGWRARLVETEPIQRDHDLRWYAATTSNDEYPAAPVSEDCLDWIPRGADIGIGDLKRSDLESKSKPLPPGVKTRLVLPKGRLGAGRVARLVTGSPALWQFRASGVVRAIAEHVVLDLVNVQEKLVLENEGGERLEFSEAYSGRVELCLTHDVETLDAADAGPVKSLMHLSHLGSLPVKSNAFVAPELRQNAATGYPICHFVRFQAR